MPLPGTARETTALLWAFARKIGQIPILVRKESPGYVFNAMYNSINREAITLAANGVASVEDVDRAWMGIFKMPIGPFGMLDGVGLDTVWHISDYWAGQRRRADAPERRVLEGVSRPRLPRHQERRRLLSLPEPGVRAGRLRDIRDPGCRRHEPAAPPAPLAPSPPQERPWGFRGQRGITAAFAPAHLALYRSLLPAAFDLPESPLVVVTVDQLPRRDAPLVPTARDTSCLPAAMGRTGWFVVTMPVDDRTAMRAGAPSAFPSTSRTASTSGRRTASGAGG